jgi:2-phosphosulfolactate phosphatase
MSSVQVCLTPDLIHQYTVSDQVVVVVDIFRATSCMVTGMAHGLSGIHPVDSVEKCRTLGAKGFITAGERNGKKIDDFHLGNSPFDYQKAELSGKKVAVTTTNGTYAIAKAKEAREILIGAFLNVSATTQYLKSIGSPVLILCAGWKGAPNLEDTLFAGMLVSILEDSLPLQGDSALIAGSLYRQHQNDLSTAAMNSSHAKRLSRFGIEKDLEFCMQRDVYDLTLAVKGGEIVKI